jgi:23S rRNA (cytidine2498-2'-O)-methyltransferase
MVGRKRDAPLQARAPTIAPAVVTPLGATVYLAASGYEAELHKELGADAKALGSGGRLFVAPGPPRPAAWAANVWFDPVRIEFDSIAQGARALSALGNNWALAPSGLFRRATLLGERVPFRSAKPIVFPSSPPPIGSWTLIEAGTIVAAARCSSPFPNGEARFVEDREHPPSRAYLKLWEALTIAGRRPGPGSRCVDLGSSPGGWTWALERLGARVLSVDKAPLASNVSALSRVKFLKESAFALDPASAGRVDWVVSDVICYPARIVGLVDRWLEAHPGASFIVTIKFQGATEMTPLTPLYRVEGSRLVHLHHNKHELTWIRIAPGPPRDGKG